VYDWIGELEARSETRLYYRGRLLLDEAGALLLEYIDRYGSILMAARVLGMPYSRAWERVSRVERMLGVEIVDRRRGGRRGGGAALTEAGRALLARFRSTARATRALQPRTLHSVGQGLLIAGSHDILLELVIGSLRGRGERVEAAWIGSGGGLAALMLGEADAAPMHLYDEETGEYNIPFLKRYWLSGKTLLLVGYERELVVAYRSHMKVGKPEDLFGLLAEGKLRLVNRNAGSGTREVVEAMLRRAGCSDPRGIPGYAREVYTHLAAARAIASGEADVGVMLRQAAEFYGLRWLHLKWERYDIALLKSRFEDGRLRALVNLMQPEKLAGMIGRRPGYRLRGDTGSIVSI